MGKKNRQNFPEGYKKKDKLKECECCHKKVDKLYYHDYDKKNLCEECNTYREAALYQMMIDEMERDAMYDELNRQNYDFDRGDVKY